MTNSTSMPTLQDLFNRSIQIENQARLLYQELEKRFAHHPESSALWKALAADEEIHAQVLTKALAAIPSEKLADQAPAAVWTSITEISNHMSQDLLGAVKCLKDAYELAH